MIQDTAQSLNSHATTLNEPWPTGFESDDYGKEDLLKATRVKEIWQI